MWNNTTKFHSQRGRKSNSLELGTKRNEALTLPKNKGTAGDNMHLECTQKKAPRLTLMKENLKNTPTPQNNTLQHFFYLN